jgi:hypothetical protein
MTYQTYRYRWNGVTATYIDERIDPAFPVAIVDTGPRVQMDVSADDSTRADLDAIMAQRGWSFLETNPTSPTPQTVRQVQSEFLSLDQSTGSTAFVALLTRNITTQNGMLEVYATAATNAIVTPGFTRLVLDGVPIAQSGAGHLVGVAAHALMRRVPILAGPHVVELQWRTAVGGTLQCQPITQPDREHASLLVRETF